MCFLCSTDSKCEESVKHCWCHRLYLLAHCMIHIACKFEVQYLSCLSTYLYCNKLQKKCATFWCKMPFSITQYKYTKDKHHKSGVRSPCQLIHYMGSVNKYCYCDSISPRSRHLLWYLHFGIPIQSFNDMVFVTGDCNIYAWQFWSEVNSSLLIAFEVCKEWRICFKWFSLDNAWSCNKMDTSNTMSTKPISVAYLNIQ